jgi:16S rRNA (adenine1518-N6/adenine1519-N6)-dimethyltransferase
MNPKKSLGQHWLFDESSLNAMLEAGNVQAGDVVLEVGPGLGTLTKKLCEIAERVVAVELDDILAANLKTNVAKRHSRLDRESSIDVIASDSKSDWIPSQAEDDTKRHPELASGSNIEKEQISDPPMFPGSDPGNLETKDSDLSFLHSIAAEHKLRQESSKNWIPSQAEDDARRLPEKVKVKNLEVVNKSILDFDYSTLPKGYKVIANIPYYLTSNLLRKLLEAKNKPANIALLIQKEVAERVVAKPGQMSILSISVQFYAEAKLKELVPAELFTPPPKVDSQIIQITPRASPLFPDVDEKEFFKLVRAGFSEKRKKLRSSLSGGLQITKEQADELIKNSNISPNARAQELTLEQWHDLYKKLN